LAQIKGLRGGTSEIQAMAERVEADVAYIEGWSFWRDVKIMLLTIPHLLLAENAY
jgi:putative colanic acid biosynthesis UDP-glucose lipid carrier transferase